jgi:hypothetical protein
MYQVAYIVGYGYGLNCHRSRGLQQPLSYFIANLRALKADGDTDEGVKEVILVIIYHRYH